MKIDLSGLHALVGAASRGLGKASAISLAQSNARVSLLGRNEEALKDICASLDAQGDEKHNYLLVDYSNYEEYCVAISEYIAQDPVDILVNNTPGPKAGTVSALEEQDYQAAFDMLFKITVLNSNLVIPHMKKQGFGRIITVSSVTVRQPKENLVLSNTMRIALQSWNSTLAKEQALYGITVNTILTGYFDTERLQELIKANAEKQSVDPSKLKEKMIESLPMKRFGSIEEYANLVTFLASSQASYISGASIPIDGALLNVL